MASSGKLVFFFFFLAVFSTIQARESKFFSKFTRYSITENTGRKESTISSVPIQAPTSAPAPAPALEFLPDVPVPAPAIEDLPDVPVLAPAQAPVIGESENGYGLFSEDSTSTTTTTTTAANENELLNEELDGVHFNKNNYNNKAYKVGSGFTNNYYNNGYKLAGESYETGNQNSGNGFTNNYNNNGYKLAGESYATGNQNNGNGYTNSNGNNGYKLAGNQNSGNGYSNNNGNTNSYNNNGYETERQGMSDTRYMEGGKYYYHVKNTERQGMSDTRFMEGGKYSNNVNYYPANEYDSGKVNTQNQGSYGNVENPNEFNTMDYESQEGYEESQEESLP
ncbi:hypothetical protein OIU78_025575 [Salix suchowensis]|nr:hypothetical protein OIU78_025575 [Salix suchowensis]